MQKVDCTSMLHAPRSTYTHHTACRLAGFDSHPRLLPHKRDIDLGHIAFVDLCSACVSFSSRSVDPCPEPYICRMLDRTLPPEPNRCLPS